jgi:hypothetical protein
MESGIRLARPMNLILRRRNIPDWNWHNRRTETFHASFTRMFKPNRRSDHDVIIFMAARAGALGILLCFLFAVVVLFVQGNPVLLFALLCAGSAIVMFVRHHLKWLAAVERMRTQEGARSVQLMRPREIAVVEDVVFHEVPRQKQKN